MKIGKREPENIITCYYQVTKVFNSVLSIDNMGEINMTGRLRRPGSKYDKQIQKWKS